MGDRILGARSARRRKYVQKASSELVVARRRRGADNGRQHVRVAAADRVQGPLGEDDGDDAVERDDRRVPRARERVVVEAEHLTVGLDDAVAEVLEAAAEDDVEGARVFALVSEALENRGLYVAAEDRVFFRASRALSRKRTRQFWRSRRVNRVARSFC